MQNNCSYHVLKPAPQKYTPPFFPGVKNIKSKLCISNGNPQGGGGGYEPLENWEFEV